MKKHYLTAVILMMAFFFVSVCYADQVLELEAQAQLEKELGAFEITAHQRELAKKNEAGYSVLDALGNNCLD